MVAREAGEPVSVMGIILKVHVQDDHDGDPPLRPSQLTCARQVTKCEQMVTIGCFGMVYVFIYSSSS